MIHGVYEMHSWWSVSKEKKPNESRQTLVTKIDTKRMKTMSKYWYRMLAAKPKKIGVFDASKRRINGPTSSNDWFINQCFESYTILCHVEYLYYEFSFELTLSLSSSYFPSDGDRRKCLSSEYLSTYIWEE